jgi:molybdopterin biosynthesis enzyme
VEKGVIARITTGSAVPEGANAIVMVEDTILLPKGIFIFYIFYYIFDIL